LSSISILFVDDDEAMCEMVQTDFELRGFKVKTCNHALEALKILDRQEFDVIVSDMKMPHINGLELCDKVFQKDKLTPFLLLTAFGEMDLAVEALRNQVFDFVTKPVEMEVLAAAADRAAQHKKLNAKVKRLTTQVSKLKGFEKMIGSSQAMKDLFDQIQSVSQVKSTVLIRGESGTGKELVARCIHDSSPRSKQPFVSVNCSAIPLQLMESEMFGHVKGAFTDASQSREGCFLQANQGTLFLDEVGDLPLELQSKLLRTIEQRVIRPVGADFEKEIDVRIIAATNQDLEGMIEAKLFRLDLFHRLNVLPLFTPALRHRENDLLELASHYFQSFCEEHEKSLPELTTSVLEKLTNYSWPGNVRELKNVMERLVVLSNGSQLNESFLPIEKSADVGETVKSDLSSIPGSVLPDPNSIQTLAMVEKNYISKVLEYFGGNRSLAAKALGVDRKTLYRKLQEESKSESS